MSGFEAGKLDRRITIQRDTGTGRDAHGGTIPDWQPFASNIWAGYKKLRGTERYVNSQLLAEATCEWIVRYKAGITALMRVIYGERTFDILDVDDPEEQHVEMRLICKENL